MQTESTFWNRTAFRLAMVAASAFLVLTTLAMFTYTGGAWVDPLFIRDTTDYPGGLVIQATRQKLIVYASIFWLLLQANGAARFAHTEGNQRTN